MVHVRLEYRSVYYAILHSHNVLFSLYCMHAGPRTAVGSAVSLKSQRYQIRYPVRPHTFFLLSLIQEGQLSVIGESIWTLFIIIIFF